MSCQQKVWLQPKNCQFVMFYIKFMISNYFLVIATVANLHKFQITFFSNISFVVIFVLFYNVTLVPSVFCVVVATKAVLKLFCTAGKRVEIVCIKTVWWPTLLLLKSESSRFAKSKKKIIKTLSVNEQASIRDKKKTLLETPHVSKQDDEELFYEKKKNCKNSLV